MIINLEQTERNLFMLSYKVTVFPRIQGGVPVFFHLRHIYIYIYTFVYFTIYRNRDQLWIRVFDTRIRLRLTILLCLVDVPDIAKDQSSLFSAQGVRAVK